MILLLPFLFQGCSHPMDPNISMKPPKYVEELPEKEEDRAFSNKGSLFGQGDSPLFSDRKAMRVHDIVQVTISETSTASSSGKKKLKKSETDDLNAPTITGPANGALNSAVTKLSRLVNPLALQGDSTSSFNGEGTNDRKEKFETTVSARIIKVLPNNNYFIEGSKELLIDGEKTSVQISGVIRSDDIDKNNKISSALIADAKIAFKTEGDIERYNNQGWLSKITTTLWPH